MSGVLSRSRVVVVPFQIFGHTEALRFDVVSFYSLCNSTALQRLIVVSPVFCEIVCPEDVSGSRFEAGVMEW